MERNEDLHKSMDDLCSSSLQILSAYYDFQCQSIANFILPYSKGALQSNVLFQENEDCLSVGIQFSTQIFVDVSLNQNISRNSYISLNTASIIAEETSHLKFILDAVENDKKISLLDIEMFGEIDRFLCLMHWNYKQNTLKIPHNWSSLHDIFDTLFVGNRFLNHNLELYIEAEKRAFYHIKNAFQNVLDNTFCDFSTINQTAKTYLKKLRRIY